MTDPDSRALISEKDARLLNRIMLDIAKEVRIDRRFNGRVNNLQLLADRKRPDETVCRMSEPEWKDHPQIQLLLERRDRYLSSRQNLEIAQDAIAKCRNEIDPQELPRVLQNLVKLENQVSDHLEAMESVFVAIRRETAGRTKNLISMVTEAAKMAENARISAEKLEIERQKVDGTSVNDLIAQVVKDNGEATDE